MVALAALGLVDVVLLQGCSSTSATRDYAGCQRESDCPAGLVCGYKIGDGCAAHGVCIARHPAPGQPACGALRYICGCNGVTEVIGCNYLDGFAPGPVASTAGPCADDAGAGDAGATCAGWGAACGASSCCAGLGCSASGSTSLPGNCVPL